MAHKPTNVTRLERDPCRTGLADCGPCTALPLHPDANDPGHDGYGEMPMVGEGGVSVDFDSRYSEKAVKMRAHMSAVQLVEVARTFVGCELGAKPKQVGIDAIFPASTSVGVVRTLAGRGEDISASTSGRHEPLVRLNRFASSAGTRGRETQGPQCHPPTAALVYPKTPAPGHSPA